MSMTTSFAPHAFAWDRTDFPILLALACAAAIFLAYKYAAVAYTKERSISASHPSRPKRRSLSSNGATCAVDSVLYRASQPLECCDDEYDAIVIGSGIGGLTTASLLARQKYRVLVLEQHYKAGGCCHTFKSNGYKFGTGIHYVGEIDKPLHRAILDAVTSKREPPLQWDPLVDNFDTIFIGTGATARQYEIISGGYEAQKNHLKKQFPEKDHAAIDEFYDLIPKVHIAFRKSTMLKFLPLSLTKFMDRTGLHKLFDGGFHKYSSKTVAEAISSLTDNEDLQAVLKYGWLANGCEPARKPFALQVGNFGHCCDGAFYPHGGPDQIPRKIIPTIIDAGGEVLVGASVKRITVDENTGRAVGVEMKDGRRIFATKAVISDAGFSQTVKHLLSKESKCRENLVGSLSAPPSNVQTKVQDDEHNLHTGMTGMYLCVGLKGDHDLDFRLPRTQFWTYPSSSAQSFDNELSKLKRLSLADVLNLEPHAFSTYISSPSGKDSTWKNKYPGRSTLEIMTYVPWSWFKDFGDNSKMPSPDSAGDSDPGGKPGSHGIKYEDAKHRLAEKFWIRAVEVLTANGATNLPRSLAMVDHFQVASPLTFAHFLHRDCGEWYGLDNDMARFEPQNYYERLRPEVPEVPHLFITGQDLLFDGFLPTMIGGALCASKVTGLSLESLLVD